MMFVGVCCYFLTYCCQRIAVIVIIRVIYYHLFSHDVTLYTHTKQAHEELAVSINVEHHRVVIRFVGEEYGERCEHGGGNTLAEPYRPHTATRHSVAGVVENIVHDEHNHRYYHRNTKPTLADNGTERSTDKEEYQARKGLGEFVYGLNLVLSYQAVAIRCHHSTEVHLRYFCLHPHHSIVYGTKFFISSHFREYRVNVERFRSGHIFGSLSVNCFFFKSILGVSNYHRQGVVICSSDAVVCLIKRIEVALYAVQTLTPCIVRQCTGISKVEVGVEVKHYSFPRESLSTIWYRSVIRQFRVPHVFKPLAAP